MAYLSHSALLQALGWAIFNSLWQVGILWCVFILVKHFMGLKTIQLSRLAVGSIFISFILFILTFITEYFNPSFIAEAVGSAFAVRLGVLQTTLLAASLTYCCVLIIPVFRLIKNYRVLGQIQTKGLRKADHHIRLFVKKISNQLAIRHTISVYISDIVRSPLTVGCIKPVILLPVSALTSLSPAQIEAVLLHELSHIKRNDYLLNLLVNIASTFLYFNPFVKLFLNVLEHEREAACDDLVLQYGYDRLDYASALVLLQQQAIKQESLALCATGRSPLVERIQKIAGLEQKKVFKRRYYAVFIAVLAIALGFNSVTAFKQTGSGEVALFQDQINAPFSFVDVEPFDRGSSRASHSSQELNVVPEVSKPGESSSSSPMDTEASEYYEVEPAEEHPTTPLTFAAANEVELSLTKEQTAQVNTTVEETKKMIANVQWQKAEKEIGELMTEAEKQEAKQAYIKVLGDVINWDRLKDGLKAGYDKADWKSIEEKLAHQQSEFRIDSLHKVYVTALAALERAAADQGKVSTTPLPDQSMQSIQQTLQLIRQKVDTLQQIKRLKEIVRL